ncbi:MAG: Transketolase central region [candidate division TM6 bacterium GW2011_GWF2_32_72]|nr:MAG: Transketolase central region [candidate division TM6 bacterium GW2011_GWF2_32_72]
MNKKYNQTLNTNLFSPNIEIGSQRDGYGKGVLEAGNLDKNVVVLCCDLAESTRSEFFKNEYPERFIEVGVAEQNMAGIGAGLAAEGFIPFCSSYAVFNPGRNWDQIRVSVCYNNWNVKIIGAHAGISVGPDGATHQALEDIAITRVLPNMVVLAPCDEIETKKAVMEAAKINSPVYIRFGRIKSPIFTTEETPFAIGKAQVFREGSDATIISCGYLMYEALKAAEELFKNKIDVEVINCPSIKPLDKKTIISSLNKTKCLVTVEEHQVAGGMGSAILEMLAQEDNYSFAIKMMGMQDKFGESGDPYELLKKYGLTSQDIVNAVMDLLNKKGLKNE